MYLKKRGTSDLEAHTPDLVGGDARGPLQIQRYRGTSPTRKRTPV